MAGPWEKYQRQSQPSAGPWTKYQTSAPQPEQTPANAEPSLGGQLRQRAENIGDAVTGKPIYGSDDVGVPARAVRVGGQVSGGIGDIIGAGVGKVIDLIPDRAKHAVGGAVRKVGDIQLPLVGDDGQRRMQPISQALNLGGLAQGVAKSYEDVPQGEKEFFGDLVGTADLVGGVAAAKPLIGAGKSAVRMATAPIDDMLRNAAREGLEGKIKTGISKGVKPTVIGKPSMQKLDKFYDNAVDAVKTIAQNRSALNLVDEAGEAIPYPRNAAEFAQAIDKTKKHIYQQYHNMALSAGDAGAQFDVKPIMRKLDEFISGSDYKKLPPDARRYAESLKGEIAELAGESPEVIEARIADFNQSLAGFYDGRTQKNVARIDASIANALREQLDDQITSASGPGYQGLKNQYGSLKSIEREVAKRALVNARRANKSVLDFTDIFTGGDIAAGILSMNPALIAKGAAGKGIKEVFKALNDPDRALKNMFKTAYGVVDENVISVPKPSPFDFARTADVPESPAFARQGRSIDRMIAQESSDRANSGAIAEANQARRAAMNATERAQAQMAADEGRQNVISAIRGLRPRLTPAEELRQTMRDWQAGRVR